MHTRSLSRIVTSPARRLVDGQARLRILALLAALMLLAAACGGEDETPEEGDSQTEAAVLCPMTGLEAGDAPIDRPALAVKIDNAPPARPQAGLEAADIVYEELGEGGLTRLLAFFHCNDADDLGPIRSARNVDPEIIQQYAPALFGYSGANSQVLAKVAATDGLIDLVHGSHGDAYRREASRNSPYNLFSTTESLRSLEAAEGVEGPPSVGFVFNPELLEAEPPGETSSAEAGDGEDGEGAEASPTADAAEAATSVEFEYSAATRVRYSYDEDAQRYLRFHGDTPHTLASGDQAGAVNVVIMKVEITDGTVRDASGSLTKDTKVVGEGDVVVLRGGTVEFGTWNRPSLTSELTLESNEGGTLELAPGSTWVHLVGNSQPVTVE